MLLWLCILSQSQSSKTVLKNVELFYHNIMKHQDILSLHYVQVLSAIKHPHSLHRFPNKMAQYIYASLERIKKDFKGDVTNVFSEPESVIFNLQKFDGIGKHKARICYGLYKLLTDRNYNISFFFDENLGCSMDYEVIAEELLFLKNE